MDPRTILLALLELPPAVVDRDLSLEQRTALILPEAMAIARVAKTPRQAAILIAQSDSETHQESNVLTGHCERSRWKCDRGHARGPWSVHRWCHRGWALPDGSFEALVYQAQCALGQFWHGENRWSGKYFGTRQIPPLHGGFSALASLPPDWVEAPKRAALVFKVEANLYRLAASSKP